MPEKSSLFDLTGRIALVTGSSQGLGLSMAKGLAQHGARVVLNGRDEKKLAASVAALRAEGLAAEAAAFDVTKGESAMQAVDRIEREIGPIHILINNAGIQWRSPLAEMSEEQWRAVLDGDLTSAFLVARAVAPRMLARGAGKVINICSVMSELSRPSIGNYAAAKGGLKMLTRAMAVEWARQGVQANAIAPGYFATELNKSLMANEEFNNFICRRTPAGRWGQPEELIGAAVFLSSRASDYVSGHMLAVDGGMLAAI
jgi:gluconate 5-dehydrogenase